MAVVRPFRALRPKNELAGAVIAPPYDVLSEAEARAIATNRQSFVRVTRSEVDLPEGSDAHGEAAYAKAKENLAAFVADGVLVEDAAPTYYLYGQVMGSHRQIGVLAACSVAEYDQGTIKKHEFTRPDKEDDRTHHMEVLDAQVGLVFLAYKPTKRLATLIAEGSAGEPAWRVTTEDGVEHALWPVPAEKVAAFEAAFADLPELYIADGHHRSAAAARVFAKRKDAASSVFLAGLFPSDKLQILAYNRLVKDLNGQTPESFLAAVEAWWELTPDVSPTPRKRGEVTMYLNKTWYRLRPRPGLMDLGDAVARLDVSVLQDHLLQPILGIDDPRRSERIAFVGGIRGHEALSGAVDRGEAAVAFHCFPTGMDQLFEVADAGQVMPPKSTWFEPKLREGVVSRWLK